MCDIAPCIWAMSPAALFAKHFKGALSLTKALMYCQWASDKQNLFSPIEILMVYGLTLC